MRTPRELGWLIADVAGRAWYTLRAGTYGVTDRVPRRALVVGAALLLAGVTGSVLVLAGRAVAPARPGPPVPVGEPTPTPAAPPTAAACADAARVLTRLYLQTGRGHRQLDARQTVTASQVQVVTVRCTGVPGRAQVPADVTAWLAELPLR